MQRLACGQCDPLTRSRLEHTTRFDHIPLLPALLANHLLQHLGQLARVRCQLQYPARRRLQVLPLADTPCSCYDHMVKLCGSCQRRLTSTRSDSLSASSSRK